MLGGKQNSEINIIRIESESVLDCLDFDILVIDKDFKIVFANKAFLDSVGLKRSEAIGQYCYKLSHNLRGPCKPPSDPCPIEEVIRTGKPAVKTHRHNIKKGDEKLVNVTAAPIGGNGRAMFLHISLPVKEGKTTEETTRKALDKTMDVLEVVRLYQEQMKEIKEKTFQLERTKKDLEAKMGKLERFNKLAVGRELKMVELKKKIKELESG